MAWQLMTLQYIFFFFVNYIIIEIFLCQWILKGWLLIHFWVVSFGLQTMNTMKNMWSVENHEKNRQEQIIIWLVWQDGKFTFNLFKAVHLIMLWIFIVYWKNEYLSTHQKLKFLERPPKQASVSIFLRVQVVLLHFLIEVALQITK